MSQAPERNALGQPVGPALPHWIPARRPPRQVLEGGRVRLEPLDRLAHAAQLFEAYAQDATGGMWTYLPTGPFATASECAAWVESVQSGSDPSFLALVERATGRALGVAAFMRIDPANGSIEVGHIAFSPQLARTAMATEAMVLMMEQAFALGYRRYEWKCHALNLPSRQAALRLGFTQEGLFRQDRIVKGRSRDTAWFSILDSEWPALNTAFQTWLAADNFAADGGQIARLSALVSAARAGAL
jgi:RimJ/RimL family protein N-acetyltransferase